MGSTSDTTPTSILSEYLTKKELAEQLHKTVRTIDRMNLAGDGPPPTRLGRTTLYRREAVLDWLKSREVTPACPARKRGGAR
jgi:predicted DNA-binding transcriptional regulator AlpA